MPDGVVIGRLYRRGILRPIKKLRVQASLPLTGSKSSFTELLKKTSNRSTLSWRHISIYHRQGTLTESLVHYCLSSCRNPRHILHTATTCR